jgi:hypothetical protein
MVTIEIRVAVPPLLRSTEQRKKAVTKSIAGARRDLALGAEVRPPACQRLRRCDDAVDNLVQRGFINGIGQIQTSSTVEPAPMHEPVSRVFPSS